MRWSAVKSKPVEGSSEVRLRFAWLPLRVKDEYVWLEYVALVYWYKYGFWNHMQTRLPWANELPRPGRGPR